MTFVLPLGAVRLGDAPRVGAKAARLGELRAAGFPVPDGLCVTVAACRAQVASGPANADAATLRGHLADAPLLPELEAPLRQALAALDGRSVAVRSSALAEDLEGASFAGQHDTVLDVRGVEAVLRALRRCWASLFGERALEYRRRHPVAPGDLALACLVQEMVPARHAGVAFSADPRNGRRDRVLVEAVAGLGEALVSGLASGDRCLLSTGSGELLDPPPGGPISTPLDVVRAAARLATAVTARLGEPQDVEWAESSGIVHLLQARPITALPPEPVPQDEAKRPLGFLPTRVREMMHGPLTPLTEDVAVRSIVPTIARNLHHHGLVPDPSLVPLGRHILRCQGQSCFDLTEIRDRLFPQLDELSVLAVLEGDAPPPLRALSLAPLRRLGLAAVPMAARFARSAWQLQALSERACSQLEQLLRPLEAEAVDSWDDERLVASLARLEPVPGFAQRLVESAPANAIARLLGTPLLGLLARLMVRWCGEPAEAVATLTAGAGGLAEVDCAQALWELSRTARGTPEVDAALRRGASWEELRAAGAAAAFVAGFEAFLDRFGHRAIGEVDLARPRFREQPAYPLSIVTGYLDAAPDDEPRKVAERQLAAREALEARVAGRLRYRPLRRIALSGVRRLARAVGPASENTKFQIVRLLWLLRQAALTWGARRAVEGRLERAGDVFFLRLDELREPTVDRRALILERRAQHEAAARAGTFDVVDALGRPILEWLERTPAGGKSVVRGTGTSPGRASGPVAIVRDPANGVRLAPGSVLVAPYTDPAWTPLFVGAAAVVVEVGSVLSHASIVARELGVPSVVAAAGATRLLRPGQWVEVDGGAGTVRCVAPRG